MDEQNILDMLNKNYSIKFNEVTFLRDGGCVSYSSESDSGKYLLKIVKPAFLDTVKQSAEVISYLSTHDFPVPRIIPTMSGKPYDFYDGRMFILFEFVEGREPEIGEKIEEIGELTGRLYRIMESYVENLTVRAKPFFVGRYIDLLRRKIYPEQKLEGLVQYSDELWESVKDLPRGYCHGDLHRGNLLLTSFDKLYFLDFDTSCIAFPSFDIMVMCDATDYFNFSPDGYDIATRLYEKFLVGYEKHRKLTEAEHAAFYDFIAIRHYQLQATIIEIYGLDCVDEAFVNRQLDWLKNWRDLCSKKRG